MANDTVTNTLGPEFLDESFEIFGPRENGIQKTMNEITQRTVYRLVNPCDITIFSLINSRGKNKEFDVIRIKPDYVSINLLMPQNMNQIYFQKKNNNAGGMSIQTFKNAGMTNKQIREIEENGFFLQYKDEKGSLITLIPSKAFLSTLCKRLGIGKLNRGIDPLRDIYIASKLKYADPFTLVYREERLYAKAFACFSPKTAVVPQNVIFDYKKLLGNHNLVGIKQWKYTHFITEVDFAFTDIYVNTNKKAKITTGVRLSFSDVGDASFTLQNTLYLNGGVVLLGAATSKKRSNQLNPEDMVKDYMRHVFPKLNPVVKELEEWDQIQISNKKQAVERLLEVIEFNAALGLSSSSELRANYVDTITGSGTLLDVVLCVLKIPGIIKSHYKGYAVEKASACIGRLFNINIRKVLKC